MLEAGLLTNPAFSRDLAHAIDTLGLDDVILAFLGPAAGGAEAAPPRPEVMAQAKVQSSMLRAYVEDGGVGAAPRLAPVFDFYVNDVNR